MDLKNTRLEYDCVDCRPRGCTRRNNLIARSVFRDQFIEDVIRPLEIRESTQNGH